MSDSAEAACPLAVGLPVLATRLWEPNIMGSTFYFLADLLPSQEVTVPWNGQYRIVVEPSQNENYKPTVGTAGIGQQIVTGWRVNSWSTVERRFRVIWTRREVPVMTGWYWFGKAESLPSRWELAAGMRPIEEYRSTCDQKIMTSQRAALSEEVQFYRQTKERDPYYFSTEFLADYPRHIHIPSLAPDSTMLKHLVPYTNPESSLATASDSFLATRPNALPAAKLPLYQVSNYTIPFSTSRHQWGTIEALQSCHCQEIPLLQTCLACERASRIQPTPKINQPPSDVLRMAAKYSKPFVPRQLTNPLATPYPPAPTANTSLVPGQNSADLSSSLSLPSVLPQKAPYNVE
ncbi:hypothetical protein VTL71DRAFT_9399 [Oculimacula yallundae]|uniref:Uncharacterized protein n=1 Tax=Oculimacula yallundae TaxID=86028 RepID=A0ABR4BSX5_9HELO